MISVEGVSKRYGPVVAVDRLSFAVQRGEVVGFLGPNGAGKTTTMRMITGTLQPDEGAVLLDGVRVTDEPMAAKRRIGYLPEANPLYDELLVSEYLDYVADLRGLSPAEARSGVSDAVDETDIGAVFYRPIAECSKGYRQRIGLASAILHRPEVLILDEPTEGLDPNQRVEIRRLVGSLGRERTVLLSTHVMQEVEATCSRLVILSQGKLAAQGSVQELLAARTGGARYIVEAEGQGVGDALGSLAGVRSHTEEVVNGRVRIQLEAGDEGELRPAIFRMARDRGWTLWELHRERASLEQVFRRLTAEACATGAVVEEVADEAGGAGSERAEEAQT
ncbi:MAG TPA: ATP-binding cassette domain-containing protein [Longimicrobiales bacterium]|nr:ATP-binding cassette domain-containing protein [Longimicrobiales bacterium]